jgi:hypothetical protein
MPAARITARSSSRWLSRIVNAEKPSSVSTIDTAEQTSASAISEVVPVMSTSHW